MAWCPTLCGEVGLCFFGFGAKGGLLESQLTARHDVFGKRKVAEPSHSVRREADERKLGKSQELWTSSGYRHWWFWEGKRAETAGDQAHPCEMGSQPSYILEVMNGSREET